MRLHRPYIPLEVRCRVVLRQLGTFPAIIDMLIEDYRKLRNLGDLLKGRLGDLADQLGCEVADLRLDHDPALCNRQRLQYSSVVKPTYFPDANDPEHLIYRTKAGHDIKTRVRGDGAQHSDLALLRIEKRRNRKKSTNRLAKHPKRRNKRPWPKRPFPKRIGSGA